MSRANPTVIGAFVIGALALVVTGLLLFGHARWFAERNTYIAYFPGSVKGLRVGAPVDFRGVAIGEVTDIRVVFDPGRSPPGSRWSWSSTRLESGSSACRLRAPTRIRSSA